MLTDDSVTVDKIEQHTSSKKGSDRTITPVDTVQVGKSVDESKQVGDNDNTSRFPFRCKNACSIMSDVPVASDNFLRKRMPDATDIRSSFSPCSDTDIASVQPQSDVSDSLEAETSNITAPRTTINEFSPISDVLSQDSNNTENAEKDLDSEEDIEEFFIQPITNRTIDKQEADTISLAGVGTGNSKCEKQERAKSSVEDLHALNSGKYEHLPPDIEQETLSCGISQINCNDTDSENLIVISQTDEFLGSENKAQNEPIFDALDTSNIMKQKSDPHELSIHRNPVIEIVNDTDESEAEKVDTITELGHQHSSCKKGFQTHVSANDRSRDKPADIRTNDSEELKTDHKERSEHLKKSISKNRKCPLIKESKYKVYNKKKVTDVPGKKISTNIRNGEKTAECRKSFIVKKQIDSLKDLQNVKTRYMTDKKCLSTGHIPGKRQEAGCSEKKHEVNGYGETDIRPIDNLKRKFKENYPSPETKKVRLNDQISSQSVGKKNSQVALGISGDTEEIGKHKSNEIEMINKPPLFSKYKENLESEKLSHRPAGAFKAAVFSEDTRKNDVKEVGNICAKYHRSEKLLQASDEINKRVLIHDNGNTATKAKHLKKSGQCRKEQVLAGDRNYSFDKDFIQDRTINKSNHNLQAKCENLNMSQSELNLNIYEHENFSCTQNEIATVTLEKKANRVLTDEISSFHSSKYEGQMQNPKGMKGRKLLKESDKVKFKEVRRSSKIHSVKRKFQSEQREEKQISKSVVSNIPESENFVKDTLPKNNKELLSTNQDFIENVKQQVFNSLEKDEIKYQPNFRPYYRCNICCDLFFTSQERLDFHNTVSHNIEKSHGVNTEEYENDLMTSRRVQKVWGKASVNKDVWTESGNPESVRRVLSTLIMENNSDKSQRVKSKIEKTSSNATTETRTDLQLKEGNKSPYVIYTNQLETSLVHEGICANEGQKESKRDVSGYSRKKMQMEDVEKHELKEERNEPTLKNSRARSNSGGIMSFTCELKNDDCDAEINQSKGRYDYEKAINSDKGDSVKIRLVDCEIKQVNDDKMKNPKAKRREAGNSQKLETSTSELQDFDDTEERNRVEKQFPEEVVVYNATEIKTVTCTTKGFMKNKKESLKERKSEFRNPGSLKTKVNKLNDLHDARDNYRNERQFSDSVFVSDENVSSEAKIVENHTVQMENDKKKSQKVTIWHLSGVRRSPSVLKDVPDNKYVSESKDNDHNMPTFLDEMVSEKSRIDSVDKIKHVTNEKDHRLHEERPPRMKSSEGFLTNASKTKETYDKIRNPCLNETHIQVKTTTFQEGTKNERKTVSLETSKVKPKTQASSEPQHMSTSSSNSGVSSLAKPPKETITGNKCIDTDNTKEVNEMTTGHFANDVPEAREPVEKKKYEAITKMSNTKRMTKMIYEINELKDRTTERLIASSKRRDCLSGDSKDSNERMIKTKKLKQVREVDDRPIYVEMNCEGLFDDDDDDDDGADDKSDESDMCKTEAKRSLLAKRLLKLSEDSDSNSMRARVDSMSSLDSLTSYLEFEEDINWSDLNHDAMHAENDEVIHRRDSFRPNAETVQIPKNCSTQNPHSKERTRRFSDEEKHKKCKQFKSGDECSHYLSDNERHISGSSKASDIQPEKYKSRHRSGSCKRSHISPTANNSISDMHRYRSSPKRSKIVSPNRGHDHHKRRRSRSRERYEYQDSNKKLREREHKPHFIEKTHSNRSYRKCQYKYESSRENSKLRHSYKCMENENDIPEEITSKHKKIHVPHRNVNEKQSSKKPSGSFRERIHLRKSSNFKPATKWRPTFRRTEKGKYVSKIKMDDDSSEDSSVTLGVDKSATDNTDNRQSPIESSSREKINKNESEIYEKFIEEDNTLNNSLEVKQKESTRDSLDKEQKASMRDSLDVKQKASTRESLDIKQKASTHDSSDIKQKASTRDSLDIKQKVSTRDSLDIKQKASAREFTLCSICDINFDSIHDLRRHMYHKHENLSKCVECRLAFVTIVDYDDHVAEKHANINAYESTADDTHNKRKEEIQNKSATSNDYRNIINDETRRENRGGRNDKPIDYQRFCRICKVEFNTREKLVDHLWDTHRKRVQRFSNERDSGLQKFTPNFAEYRRPMEGYDHSLTCRICCLRLRSKDELFHHLHVKHNTGPKAKGFEKHFSPKGLQRL